ncbi:MAG: outer membrane beta-barrel protein [Crocinitomicaceae bacterium]|nr:outer membrane beta-barrel protein [Crocinitomicaceae bacterium]
MRFVFRNLLFGVLLIFSSAGYSQGFKTAAEMGVFGGGSYYIGDLNPDVHFMYSKPAFGAIFRYNLTKRYSLRFTGSYGNVYGQDSDSDDPFSQMRNLSFKSDILELAFGVEIDLFNYNINNMKDPISPYFFYEIAYFKMNPTGELNGEDYDLQSLGTEGQGTALSDKEPYKLNQLSIPLGIGVKFNIRKRMAISIEYGIRKTFTDYLDDVSGKYVDPDLLSAYNGTLAAEFSDRSLGESTYSNVGFNRGNPANKDWYAFYGIMFTFKPFKENVCNMRGWR